MTVCSLASPHLVVTLFARLICVGVVLGTDDVGSLREPGSSIA
jgi:hypothetical protein